MSGCNTEAWLEEIWLDADRNQTSVVVCTAQDSTARRLTATSACLATPVSNSRRGATSLVVAATLNVAITTLDDATAMSDDECLTVIE